MSKVIRMHIQRYVPYCSEGKCILNLLNCRFYHYFMRVSVLTCKYNVKQFQVKNLLQYKACYISLYVHKCIVNFLCVIIISCICIVLLVWWCLTPLSTIFSYIVAVSFTGRENWSTRRKPQSCHKSLTHFIT